MPREPRLDEPDGVDLELLAERDPDCSFCGQRGHLTGESFVRGRGGARLECVNPLCPGRDPDEGAVAWEVYPDE